MALPQARFQAKVVPGASRNRVAGRYGDGVKVQVMAPPEKGKANEAVLEILAEWLKVRPGQIRVESGHAQPRKVILVDGMSQQQLQAQLEMLA